SPRSGSLRGASGAPPPCQGASRSGGHGQQPHARGRSPAPRGRIMNRPEPLAAERADAGTADGPAVEALAVVRKAIAHDSAVKHVSGTAAYIDDLPVPSGTLHLAPGYAPIAAGRLTQINLDRVRAAAGVVTVLTAADIPGRNDVSPKEVGDDPVIAADRIMFHGQVVFVVVATTREAARRAARLGRFQTAPVHPLIDVDDAL